jgi:signal peptidase II
MRCSLAFTRFVGWLIASEIILLDQWSKIMVMNIAQTTPLPIEITSFFNIVLTWNRGVSFGMLRDVQGWMPLVLTITTSCIALALAVWMMRAQERIVILALGSVIGGALGNIIDRATMGAVIDFLDFHVVGYHWPAFNIADSAIFVGVVLLVFDSIVNRHSKEKSVENPDHASP